MEYLISFLEGFITFISPCMLPMLPIYISYFAGGTEGTEAGNTKKTLTNALGFVLGFSTVFIAMGLMAGTLGSFISRHTTAFNIIGGGIVTLLGLSFMGVIRLDFLHMGGSKSLAGKKLNFFSALLFGVIFSISWTPCVSAFLGSALVLAANSQTVLKGGILLFLFSLGLGIPFILSAVLIDKLKSTLDFIKRNYSTINKISGLLLVIIGVMMMFGWLNMLLALFTIS